MMAINNFVLESLVLSVIGVLAAYLAALTYNLPWMNVLGVMIATSIFSGIVLRYMNPMARMQKLAPQVVVSEAVDALMISLLSAVAVLVVLSMRFGFVQALGLSLATGVGSALSNAVIKAL